MIFPLRITFVPFAFNSVCVPLVSSVLSQPSTVIRELSEVVTVTWIVSLSGLKMSETPPSTKGASGSGTVGLCPIIFRSISWGNSPFKKGFSHDTHNAAHSNKTATFNLFICFSF